MIGLLILHFFKGANCNNTWYSNVPTPTRVEYQDSPIQWHTNPMYIEDMEHRSSLEYGISPIWNKAKICSTSPTIRHIRHCIQMF